MGLDGEVAMRSVMRLRFDYGREVPWVRRVGREVHAIAGPNLVRLTSPQAFSHFALIISALQLHMGHPARSDDPMQT